MSYLQIKLKDILQLTPEQIDSIGDIVSTNVNFSISITDPEIAHQSEVSLHWKPRGFIAQMLNLPRRTHFYALESTLRLYWTYTNPSNITDDYQIIICEKSPGIVSTNQIITTLDTIIRASKPTKTLTDMVPCTELTTDQYVQAIWKS